MHPIIKPDLKVIKELMLNSVSTQLSMKFPLLIKTEMLKNNNISFFERFSDAVFILLINVKMPTIVGILTLMSRINIIIGWVEHIQIYNLEARLKNYNFHDQLTNT